MKTKRIGLENWRFYVKKQQGHNNRTNYPVKYGVFLSSSQYSCSFVQLEKNDWVKKKKKAKLKVSHTEGLLHWTAYFSQKQNKFFYML